MIIKSLLMAPLSYFRKNMTGNIHGRLNRCLDGAIKLEKLLFMDFAPAIFNSIAAIITIFLTLPSILALPMLLVIPIGVFIVFKQINSQKGIRVELLESKSSMDGTIVEYEVYPEGFVTNETKELFLNANPLDVVIDNLKSISKIENLDIYILSLSYWLFILLRVF